MINPTELMQSILTSEEAQILIDNMSPIYGEARVFLWLLQAVGVALDEAENCKDDFDNQSLISKATWSLRYYEEQYGVKTNSSLSYEQRRNNVFAAMRTRAPLNPAKMESILSAIGGTDVTIIENTAQNTFDVVVGLTDFADEINKFIGEAKPAHTIYNFRIDPNYQVDTSIYLGTIVDVDMDMVASTDGWAQIIVDDYINRSFRPYSLNAVEHERIDTPYYPEDATVISASVTEVPDELSNLSISINTLEPYKVILNMNNMTAETISIDHPYTIKISVNYE